jgi:benzylsuccinate CoA-transferase BbsF subunit
LPLGNSHFDMAPHGIYRTSGHDAWLTLVVADQAQWRALLRVAQGQAWTTDARFETMRGRLDHADVLDAQISAWTATFERDALVDTLRAAGIASSPVLSIEEQWCDPQLEARGIKQAVQIPIYGKEELFKAPWQFSDFGPQIERCAPTTGQHNNLVFGELLGLCADEIADLERRGVIA